MPTRSLVGVTVFALSGLLAACQKSSDTVVYVCEEPLWPYLRGARENIANHYAVERSRQVLEKCPDLGFHRRYTFSFAQAAILSDQPADAHVEAAWCSDSTQRTVAAQLKVLPHHLVFHFDYPWSTATGKYPRTEFRLSRGTLKGGFFEDLTWQCELQKVARDGTAS